MCGRTGAGKSSLAVALFRLRELSGGSIRVDGRDLACMGLARVRGSKPGSVRMCIIPQEPVLFSMSLWFPRQPSCREQCSQKSSSR